MASKQRRGAGGRYQGEGRGHHRWQRRIGLAIAEGLATEGVDIVLAARGVERVRSEASGIAKSFGVRAEGLACDVAKREGTDDLIADVKRLFGGADISINNAGTGSNETVMQAPDEKWQAYWDLHVMAAVRLARGLAPVMKERGGGVILHNASICAAQPLWYEPIYNVTKAALMMFSKTLSTELIGDNIRVDCVNPGLIRRRIGSRPQSSSPLTRAATGGPISTASRVSTRRSNGSRRQELANFFVFLCWSVRLFRRFNLLRRRGNVEVGLNRHRRVAGEGGSVMPLRQFFGLRLGPRRVHQADPISDADHARDAFRLGLGAASLIGQINQSGNRHPAVLNVNIQPVPRDRRIPMERVQNAHAHVFALQPHLDLPTSTHFQASSLETVDDRIPNRPAGSFARPKP